MRKMSLGLKDLFSETGKWNIQSEIYQLANKILYEKYAVFYPKAYGTIYPIEDLRFYSYTKPDSEYLAIIEADEILSKINNQPTLNKLILKIKMKKRIKECKAMNKIDENNQLIYDVDERGIARINKKDIISKNQK